MRERIQENVQRLEGAKAARDTRSFGSAGPEGRGGQGVWPSEPQGASSAGKRPPREGENQACADAKQNANPPARPQASPSQLGAQLAASAALG